MVAQSGKKIGDFIGGFTDRPPNGRDFYHTCYALSGMSVMQHIYGSDGSMTQIVLGHEERRNRKLYEIFHYSNVHYAQYCVEYIKKLKFICILKNLFRTSI